MAAGYNSGNLVLFQYQPEGGEHLQEQRDQVNDDVEMAESTAQSVNQNIKFPHLQYLTEFTGFAPEFDYVKAFEIPPAVTSIEWLNRQQGDPMTFVVANDKKIRLFKLRKEFVDEFRSS